MIGWAVLTLIVLSVTGGLLTIYGPSGHRRVPRVVKLMAATFAVVTLSCTGIWVVVLGYGFSSVVWRAMFGAALAAATVPITQLGKDEDTRRPPTR